ncbi:MAG: PilN domain-containing protein [Thermoanaerobaculia bacterium]
MIKINLIREGGRAAVRSGGPSQAFVAAGPSTPTNVNNLLIVALVIAGLVVSGGFWFIKHQQLVGKQEQVAARTIEAQKLEAIIKEVEDYQKRRESLEQRIKLINDLKRNQKGPVRVMDHISRDLPDLLWLDSMSLNGDTITLVGRALNPNAVANFVENLKGDPLFEEPAVGEVSQQGQTSNAAVYRFTMNFHFKTPAEGGETTDSQTGDTAPAANSGR